MFYYYFDRYYWILIVPAMLFAMWAQTKVNSTYNRYNRVYSARGMSAAQVCRQILDENGLFHIRVEHVSGKLTDHYDPRNKTLSLSDSVYGSASVAAVGVAAHECGHAIQHQKNYAPLTIRGAIVPVANIGSTLAWPLILIGLFISSRSGQALITAGIICFSLAVLFQIVTLPVEFNASRRAVRILGETGILGEQELGYTRKVLGAAALTYVAGAASAILQLLRLILLFGGRRDD